MSSLMLISSPCLPRFIPTPLAFDAAVDQSEIPDPTPTELEMFTVGPMPSLATGPCAGPVVASDKAGRSTAKAIVASASSTAVLIQILGANRGRLAFSFFMQ